MATDRANIRSRARIRADQDASTFPTDTQYNLIIDECGKTVYYDLIGAGWPVREKKTTINVAALDDHYPINGGGPIHSVTGVFRVTNGQLYELKRLGRDLEAGLSVVGSAATHYLVKVDMTTGPGIILYPGVTGGQYEVHFIDEWPGFTSDADVWRGPARSDELIVLMSAMKGARKEGEVADAEALNEEYKALWLKVVDAASWFDQRNPPRIRDVNQLGTVDPFDFQVSRDRGFGY